MDVAGIDPGVDFRKAIEDNVVTCGVLLAVIGPSWVTIKNAAGAPRLEDPNDFVRLEIASALKRNVAVIPVLVHDAKMPHPEELQGDLKDLCYRNSVELCHARWNSDVALLIKALKPYVTSTPASEQEPVHATVSVQLPPPHPAQDAPLPPKKKLSTRTLVIAGIAAFVVVAALIGANVNGSHSPAADDNSAAKPTITTTAGEEAGTETAPDPKSQSPARGDESGNEAAMGDGEQATETRLEGRWTVPAGVHRTGNSLTSMEITVNDNQLLIHAWGACPPTTCDWGTRQASLDGRSAIAVFQPEMDASQAGITRVATVAVAPGLNGLEVHVHNTFTGNGTNESNESRVDMVPYEGK